MNKVLEFLLLLAIALLIIYGGVAVCSWLGLLKVTGWPFSLAF